MEQKKLDNEFMKVDEPRRPVFQDKINSIDGDLEESEKQNATISRKVNKRLVADMQRRGSFLGAISIFNLNSKVDKIKSMMREHQPKVKLIEDSILGCLGSVMAEKSTCLIRGGKIMCDLEIEISHCQYSVHEFDNFINDIQECDCSVLRELRDLTSSLAFYLEIQQEQDTGSKGSTAQQPLPSQCCDDDSISSYDQIMINVKSNEAKVMKVNAAATGFSNRMSGCHNSNSSSNTKVSDASSKVTDDCYKAPPVRVVHEASSDYKRRSLQLSSISVNGLNLGPPPPPHPLAPTPHHPPFSLPRSGGDSKADQKTATRSSCTSAMQQQQQHESKYGISFLHSWSSSSSSSVCDQGTGSKGSKDSCMLGAKSKDSCMMNAKSKDSCMMNAKSKDSCMMGVKSKDSCMLDAIKSRLGASSKRPQDEKAAAQHPSSASASYRSNGFLSPPPPLPLPSLNSKASIPENYYRRRTDSTNSTASNTDRSLSGCSSQLATPSAASTSTPSSSSPSAAAAAKPDKSHRDYLEVRYALLLDFIAPELQLQLRGDLFSMHYHSDPMFKGIARHILKCLRFKEVLNSCLLAIEIEQDSKTKLLRRIKRLRGELEAMTMTMVPTIEENSSTGQQQQQQLYPCTAVDLSMDSPLHHRSSSSSSSSSLSLPISVAKAESCSTLSSSLHGNLLLQLSSADSSSHDPQQYQHQQSLASSQGSSSSSISLYDADFLHSRLQSIHEKMDDVDMAVSDDTGTDHREEGGKVGVLPSYSCCKGPTTPFSSIALVLQQQRQYSSPSSSCSSHDELLLQEASACIEQLRGVQQQEQALSDRLLRVQELLSSNSQLEAAIA